MAGALDAKHSMTTRLALLDARFATFVPDVSRITWRTVRRFRPATPQLGCELDGRDGLQPIRNRQFRHFIGRGTGVLREAIPARPGSACRKRMERRQPGELGDCDVSLAQCPGRTGFMCKIGKKPPVRREIATARENATTEPRARFVTKTGKIPLPDMRPVRRPPSKDGDGRCLCRRDAIDSRRHRRSHVIPGLLSGASSMARSFQPRAPAKSAAVFPAKPGAPVPRSLKSAPARASSHAISLWPAVTASITALSPNLAVTLRSTP